jgi:ATP-dependent DNA helicase RecQ
VGRCCDVCDGALAAAAPPPRARSVAESADVADAILAVVERAAPAVGRTKTVEILRGGRSKALLKYSYDALPGYGDFADWRAEDVLAEVDGLLDSGRLQSTGGRYPTLRVARAA